MITHLRTDLRSEGISQLNAFLRAEMAAVRSYRQAIRQTKNASVVAILTANLANHSERVRVLRSAIRQLGGRPVDRSACWSSVAHTDADAADAQATVFDTLEAGEEHGLADYGGAIDGLTDLAKAMVVGQLLPAQRQTLDAAHRLKQMV